MKIISVMLLALASVGLMGCPEEKPAAPEKPKDTPAAAPAQPGSAAPAKPAEGGW